MKYARILAALLLVAAVPAGAARTSADTVLTIASTTLDQTREVWVALPDDYHDTTDGYPVLYVLDAGWHFDVATTAVRMLAETSYIQAHRIPKMIVVGIVNADRNHDNTPTKCVSQHGMSFPTSGGADAFLAFLGDELIPLIDARYRTEPYRILAGWSLGGLLTMHALLDHPGVFDAHLAISPSLWWDDRMLVDRAGALAASGESREEDLVITIGTGEDGGLCFNAVHDLVDRWKGQPLAGLSLSFVEIPDEDHNHGPYKAYFDGLRALFANWFFPEAAFEAGLDSLRAHYAALSARRGYDVPIPDHIFDALARSYLAEGRATDAIAVARAQCESGPASALSYYQLGEVCRQAGEPGAARDAYATALELERRSAAPDTVFVHWVERRASDLREGQ